MVLMHKGFERILRLPESERADWIQDQLKAWEYNELTDRVAGKRINPCWSPRPVLVQEMDDYTWERIGLVKVYPCSVDGRALRCMS